VRVRCEWHNCGREIWVRLFPDVATSNLCHGYTHDLTHFVPNCVSDRFSNVVSNVVPVHVFTYDRTHAIPYHITDCITNTIADRIANSGTNSDADFIAVRSEGRCSWTNSGK